jgi:hypothetical protein
MTLDGRRYWPLALYIAFRVAAKVGEEEEEEEEE